MNARAVLSGTAVAGAFAVVAALATALPAQPSGTVPARVVDVPAAGRLLACSGPPVLTGSTQDTAVGAVGSGADEGATDEQFGQAPARTTSTTWVLAGPDAEDVTVGGLDVVAPSGPPSTVPVREGAAAATLDGAGPTALSAAGSRTLLGGLALAATPEGDLRGLSAATCTEPSTEAWLVGGGTGTGRSARLVLANPGLTVATVDVEVLTPTGSVAAPAGRGLVVPAGERREVLLEGLAPGEPTLAARVRSTGGQVTAYLADSSLRGLVPGGVDVVTAGAGPGTRQLLPAVVKAPGTEPTLRLLAPAGDAAVVTWRLLGQGDQVVGRGAVTVPAGAVVDVDLNDVPPGLYTAVVESQTPVAAAVQLLRGTPVGEPGAERADLTAATDVAWTTAVRPLGAAGTTPAVLPLLTAAGAGTGVVSHLLLGATEVEDGAGTVTVTATPVLADGRSGAPTELEVTAGRTAVVPRSDLAPPEALGVVLTATRGQVAAGLLLESEGGLLSVVGVQPGTVPQGQVELRRAPVGAWP